MFELRRNKLSALAVLAFGVLVMHEPMSSARWIGFALVWAALLVLIAESLVTARRSRRDPLPVHAAV